MNNLLAKYLVGKVEDSTIVENLENYSTNEPISILWQSRVLFYTALSMLMSGIGMFLYQNQDYLGKYVILFLMVVVIASIFFYGYKKYPKFSNLEIQPEGIYTDYILLFGAFVFISFWSYLSYVFPFFSSYFLLISVFKLIVLTYWAYYFDHKAILNLAIFQLFNLFHFYAFSSLFLYNFDVDVFINSFQIGLLSSCVLSLILFVIGFISDKYDFKRHFAFIFFTYSYHIMVLSLFFTNDIELVIRFIFVLILSAIYFKYGYFKKSFFAIVCSILYGYIALVGIVFQWLTWVDSADLFFLSAFLFTMSSVGLIVLLFVIRKKIKE